MTTKIKPKLEKLEQRIATFIGEVVTYKEHIINVEDLNVWSLQRLPEWLDNYALNQTEIISPFEITSILQSCGLECTCGMKVSLPPNKPKCCDFHDRIHAYEQATDHSTKPKLIYLTWRHKYGCIEGSYLPINNPKDSHLKEKIRLSTRIFYPELSFGKVDALRYDVCKKDLDHSLKAGIDTFTKRIGLFITVTEYLTRAQELLKQLEAISNKYNLEIKFNPNSISSYIHTGCEDIPVGINFNLDLIYSPDSKEELERYGRAMVDLSSYFSERKLSGVEKLYELASRFSAKDGLERIKQAQPLFEEYLQLYKAYLVAPENMYADF